MRIALGSDHAGLNLRKTLAQWAESDGHSVQEYGATGSEAYDYPDAADAVAQAVLDGEADLGVLVCGTGIGMSIRANRQPGIRAALACSPETARLAREHNHANVLCLGSRTTDPAVSREIFQVFLNTQPDSHERHLRRVRKLDGNVTARPIVSIMEDPHG